MNTRLPCFFRARKLLIVAPLMACFCLRAEAKPKRKDTVIMNNGDHFTGQVKRLENGLLYVETDYVSGNIGLDWNQVQSIESTAMYRIVLNDGRRLEGKIEKHIVEKEKKEDFVIREATEEEEVPSAEIFSIDTKKPTFWRDLQGAIDLGYSFTSGNSQSSLNLDTSAAYQTPKWKAVTSYDSTFSGQSGGSTTNREDLQVTFARFLGRNSFVVSLSDFLHSSQQDLNLRATFVGGYGRFLKRTTSSTLSWVGGIAYIHESFETAAGQPSDQNAEGVLGLQYKYVRFNFGEFNSQFLTFSGLSDSGRVRITTNNSLTIKLRNNFHLAFTLWDNFDSRPPVTARKNELGISSGIGWSF
jgi:putative salt-induced outer membrane protein YdiY